MPVTAAEIKTSIVRVGSTLETRIDTSFNPDEYEFAFYLQRKSERVATIKYSRSREAAFDLPKVDGSYFSIGFVRHIQTKQTAYVQSDPVRIGKPVEEAISDSPQKLCLAEIADKFDMTKTARVDVTVSAFEIETFYIPDKTDRLIVLLSGAATGRQGVVLPFFNRYKWADEFNSTILCIADSTLRLDDNLGLGWYFGDAENNPVDEMASVVTAVATKLGIPNDKIVFYGSSVGGFGAMALAAKIGHGSTAVAINPQIDIEKYPDSDLKQAFLHVCTRAKGSTKAASHCQDRLSMIRTWEQENASSARCVLVQNRQDRHHYTEHFKPFAQRFGVPEDGMSADRRMASIMLEDPRGHVAEPRSLVGRILKTVSALH